MLFAFDAAVGADETLDASEDEEAYETDGRDLVKDEEEEKELVCVL